MIETLGRYKILSVIGQGAMGVVYKAVDPVIDRVVAIKTINLNLSSDEIAEYEARFQQEIKAAGRLNHPNIVTIFDVGKTETVAYMAMELLDGRELKDILVATGCPAVTDTVDWIGQIASGLAAAHDNDIIHRDVKPSNIMIVKGGYAKITDFGIARMTASAVKTMTGLILGSPRYMSPEQVIGKNLDHRTDIFSLGVVLYEALTAKPPFDGDNVNAIMYATVNHIPDAPSSINATVPQMLDLIVAKSLAKSADERYQNMRDLVHDLAEVKRMLTAHNPAKSVIAHKQPTLPKPVSLESLGVGGIGVGKFNKEVVEPPVAPLSLNKKFDSFDATMKLAAMTNQTESLSSYISETKKMRAYTGEGAGVAASNTTKTTKPAIGTKTAITPTSSIDTSTVPIAQLEEMELAAQAYAAKQSESRSAADLDLSEDVQAKQKKKTAKRSGATTSKRQSPDTAIFPLILIGALTIAAIILVAKLIIG
jgi:eukaryotic-like serine/threonine-protein kinase